VPRIGGCCGDDLRGVHGCRRASVCAGLGLDRGNSDSAELFHNLPKLRIDLFMLTHTTGAIWDDPDVAHVPKLYLPYLFWHPYASSHAEMPKDLRVFRDDVTKRPYAVCFAHAHCTHFRMALLGMLRERLGDALMAKGMCAGATHHEGPGLGNDYPSYDKWRSCKSVFAMENTNNGAGYMTEKIMNAFMAGALPLYGGDRFTSVAHTLFDNATFLDVRNFYSPQHQDRVWGTHEVGKPGPELDEVRRLPVPM
jgi:hypothetical protein